MAPALSGIIVEIIQDERDGECSTSGPGNGIRAAGDTIHEAHGHIRAAVQRDFAGVTP